MNETLQVISAVIGATAIPSAIGVAVWLKLTDMTRQLGKMNGRLEKHGEDIDHIKGGCPLWGNPVHHLEKD